MRSLGGHDLPSVRALAARALPIVLGAGILTFGVHNIHDVTGVTEGGGIGFTLLINHWLGVPLSISSPLMDIACYALALKVLGGGFLGWSVVASGAIAGFYALWEHLPHLLPDLTAHPLTAAILGGVFVGVGAGVIVRQGASGGGDDALALSLAKLTGKRVALCYLMADVVILLLSLSYIPVERIAFSLVTVAISSPLIDFVSSVGKDEDGEAPADAEAA